MKRVLFIGAIMALASLAVGAQQYESDEYMDGRHVVILARTATPLFKVKAVENDDGGRDRIVLKNIRDLGSILDAAAGGTLQGEDQDGNPVVVEFYRECRCKDGQVVRVLLGGGDCLSCDAACDGHDGADNTRYYFLTPISCGVGIGIDPDILVMVE